MSERLERLASVFLTLAVIVIAGMLVKREFFTTEAQQPARRPTSLEVADRQAIQELGRVIGNPSPKLQLAVFNDFECPFCRGFHALVGQMIREFPSDLGLVFMHLPLPNHRLAYPAARAAECAAGDSDNFANMVEVLFNKQDSLGLKSWVSFAKEAGIKDTTSYVQCVSSSASLPRVERGIELAQKIGLGGTPGVIANGLLLVAPPTEVQLRSALERVRAGKPAFP